MGELHQVFFSPKGTTKKCAECIGRAMGMETVSYDLLRRPQKKTRRIFAEDVLFVCMPVYGGYIPGICADMLENFQGDGSLAVIAAVYGNRHYDNALVQMKEILEKRGFQVIAAGAFLAEHSVFPSVAGGRPDKGDIQAMESFGKKCRELVEKGSRSEMQRLEIKGTKPYAPWEFKGIPLHPSGNKRCVGCSACVKVCPVKAISPENPRKTNKSLCISCGACIRVCSSEARNYHGPAYQIAKAAFQKKCAVRKEAQCWYAK